jgi:hypothetical protein
MKKTLLTLIPALLIAGCFGNGDTSTPASTQAKQLPRSAKSTAAASYAYEVQLLYVAYFGRPADPAGLTNFAAALQSDGAPGDIQTLVTAYTGNAALRSLVDSFGTSNESKTLYGSGSTTSFVQAIFNNLLSRAPAADGQKFWVGAIDSGSVTRGEAAMAIAAGALANTTAQGLLDAQLINARLAVAANFTAQVSAQNAASDYAGATAAATARSMLGLVTATTDATAFEPTVDSTVATLIAAAAPTVAFVAKLGKPSRFLAGLGAGNDYSVMSAQGIKPDIVDTYLVGVGSGAWPMWNSPSGAYVTLVTQEDDAIGAIPMFTLYQMAQNGDGNLSGLTDRTFMGNYWSQVRLMFQMLGSYGKPALVNLEPDFWGYVELQAKNGDPTQMSAVVNTQAECKALPNNAVGIAQCMLTMARTYAPKTLVGFPASFFGETAPTVATFMHANGAQNADFIVAQTSDRDAGCFEATNPPSECTGRGNGPFYWDETNQSTPNYTESLATWGSYRNLLGNNLPIVWWQTPMGVPSTTPGGSYQHYRDNHVHYMLNNAGQYVNIGSVAAVFSSGATSQTTIATDGGQFQTLFGQYLKSGGSPLH